MSRILSQEEIDDLLSSISCVESETTVHCFKCKYNKQIIKEFKELTEKKNKLEKENYYLKSLLKIYLK